MVAYRATWTRTIKVEPVSAPPKRLGFWTAPGNPHAQEREEVREGIVVAGVASGANGAWPYLLILPDNSDRVVRVDPEKVRLRMISDEEALDIRKAFEDARNEKSS